MQLVLTPQLLLEAYRQGLFPMAYSADSPYIHWVCPDMRGQLPIRGLHVPRRLKQTLKAVLKKEEVEIRIDSAFRVVIEGCAEKNPRRPETWINHSIIEAYCRLYERGAAHSIELWEEGRLTGGLYGLALGGAFFGESMFSRKRDASKIVLVHTAARLWKGGFTLFDTQFVSDHLRQFGAYEVTYFEYQKKLKAALAAEADFTLPGLGQKDILREYLDMTQ